MSFAISFEHVSKRYLDHSVFAGGLKNFLLNPLRGYHTAQTPCVLEDVCFNVRHGTTVGFVGRNGAGKSTLLSLIAGVLKPDCGKITVNGRISSLLDLGAGF